MLFSQVLSLLTCAVSVLASPASIKASRAGVQTFNGKTIFQAPSNYTTPGVLYARTVELSDGSLLATWENYSPEPPQVYFPIYKSSDKGQTWSQLSKVQDTARGYGLRYQPFLYQLPAAFAGFKKGDILLSGSSIPTDLSSTHIELYASRDQGKTWEFVSHIADGGRASTTNGETPVWEPFLLLVNNELICYYSDQRDSAHGQKLVHQTTTDGKTWGSVVNDVAYPTYTDRPGMPVVARLPNGSWIMTYEYGGGPVTGNSNAGYQFPVYYKISADPKNFNAATGQALVATDGTVPTSSPYIVVTKSGRVIVSSFSNSEVFVAKVDSQGGLTSPKWVKTVTNERPSYTRSLTLLESTQEQDMLLAGGGALPPSTGNKVTVGVVNISAY